MIRFKQFGDVAYVRLNFFANLFDGALFSFAMSFVSLVVVLPVLVKKLGGNNIAIGIIPVIWTIGFNIPQIFIAKFARKFAYKKKLVLITALIQRLPWLFLSLILFLIITKVPESVALSMVLIGLMLAAVGGSINLPGWFDLISKLTPLQLRGRLFAFRSVLGALLGIVGGGIVTYVLDKMSFPYNFSLLFLLAFIVMMFSYVFLIVLKESQPNSPEQQLPGSDYMKKLMFILKHEREYRNFLIADAFLITALMADAFYTVNAMEKFSLSEGFAGHFIIVMMISMIIGNVLFGHMADRYGHKLNLLFAAGSTTIICIMAIISTSVEMYYIVFVGAAITISLIQVSRLAFIAEICAEQNRPIYAALTNMITAPFILSGILGGWIANHFGYNIVFVIAGLFSFASVVWWWYKVPEPRNTLMH